MTATIVGVMFKHEAHDESGCAVGPVWVLYEGDDAYRNFRDSDMEKGFGDEKFFAEWFTLIMAQRIARDLGVEFTEA